MVLCRNLFIFAPTETFSYRFLRNSNYINDINIKLKQK